MIIKRRKLFIGLVCLLLFSNGAILFAATTQLELQIAPPAPAPVQLGGGAPGSASGGSSVPTPVQVTIPGTAPTLRPKTSEVGVPTPKGVGISPVFNTILKYGMTSNDVKRLQELLASDPEIYPEGIVSGWFGQLTKKAVQKFQEKYNIVSSGDEDTTGYGLVGPKTRQKLAEVFAAQPAAPTLGAAEVGVPTPKGVGISPKKEIITPPGKEKAGAEPISLLKEYSKLLWQKISNFWQKIWQF